MPTTRHPEPLSRKFFGVPFGQLCASYPVQTNTNLSLIRPPLKTRGCYQRTYISVYLHPEQGSQRNWELGRLSLDVGKTSDQRSESQLQW